MLQREAQQAREGKPKTQADLEKELAEARRQNSEERERNVQLRKEAD